MRIVLADLASTDGFVTKDTVAGGYGARLRPFSRVTRVVCGVKRRLHDVPSVQLGYLAAIVAAEGHEVKFTRGEAIDGDVAIVLTSLVDHRRETAWADEQRRRGIRVGFVGLAASKLPEIFDEHGDFVVIGEPEAAIRRLAGGAVLEGRIASPAVQNLDELPFPRWDLLGRQVRRRSALPYAGRPAGGAFPVLASRGCPEFCTYCPHRILASHRMRSVDNILDELEYLTSLRPNPYIVFRDPLFTDDRQRCLDLCDGIRNRGLDLRFECETRLDHLDPALLSAMRSAGLAAISFGVETMSVETLKRSGRRPTPEAHQRLIIDECRRLGVVTAAFYVLGFLQDDWAAVASTIEYAVALGSTVAQFKLLTPYPATPMWKQLAPLVYESDWQQFDGYTPTFNHPRLSREELRFLLSAAYTRFYVRPSFLASYLRLGAGGHRLLQKCDRPVFERYARQERRHMMRAVSAA